MATATKTRASRASVPESSPMSLGAITSDDCLPSMMQACRTRICLLDTDGAPLVGDASMVVTDRLSKFGYTPNYKAATELTETNACDATLVDYLGPPSKVRDDLALDLVSPDPFVMSLLLPQGTLLALSGGGYGFAAPPIGTVSNNGVSLEFWVKNVLDGVLDPVFPYVHWAFPKCLNAQEGARELSNTVQHGLITAQAYENAEWFDGPAADFDSASDKTWQYIPTDTLPDITCGYAAVTPS